MENRSRNHCPPPPSPYPWLVYRHGKAMKSQTFYTISEDPQKVHVRSIPELRNKRVWASCHGWLVLSNEAETEFHLWNPVTLKSVELPPLEVKRKHKVKDCLLTAPPDDLDSIFLVFAVHPPSIIFCYLQDKKWITRGYGKEMKAKDEFLRQPLICNSQIYAKTTYSRMVQIEIIKPSSLVVKFQNHLPFSPTLGRCFRAHFVESCGDIFHIDANLRGIDYCEDIMGFTIFKLKVQTMTWEEVDSCPGRAFFFDNRRVISTSTIGSDKKENHIYFIKDEDNKLYSYNIQDKSISVSLPCPRLHTPWKTPFWIKPDIGSLDSSEETFIEKEEVGARKEDVVGECLDKCIEVNKGERRQKVHLLDLPNHMLQRIASHCPLFDYMNFRLVSRECRSAVPLKKWQKTNSVELERNPWLMFPGKVKNFLSVVDPRLGGKYYIKIPEVLEGGVVVYSKYGWLLMLCKNDKLMLFNPLTKSIISLPDPNPYLAQIYWFSSSPDSSECLVLGVDFDFRFKCVTRPGRTEWTIIEFWDEFSFECSHLLYPTFLKAYVCFIGKKGDLAFLRYDEEEENFSLDTCNLEFPCRSFQEFFLADCDGEELFSVFVGKDENERWVQVFKWNELTFSWEKVENLGNKSLYLCSLSSFAREAKKTTPKMGNRIYFPRFRGESIIFYSLETGKFHILNSEDSLTNYCYGTREQLRCHWIEPRC